MSPQRSKTKALLITIAVILLLSFSGTCSSSQPPYQVSIYVSLHPRAAPIHYCNGVIIQSRLVLTTASCIYYQSSVIEANGTHAVQIPVDKISVVPGAADSYNVVNTFNVLEINVAKGFNSTTLANNLAILHLDTSLPLGQREDVKWIILNDYEYEKKGIYMAGFPSLNVDPNIMLLEQVQILPHEQCTQTDPLMPNIGEGDICALYRNAYAVGPDCELPADFDTFNSDYGTGLIIRNQVIALFSQTIATSSNENTNNCHNQQPLKAVFTAVGPHLNWIYGIVAIEEMLALNQEGVIFSSPYQESGSSAIMSVLSNEPEVEFIETTTTTTTIATTTTTKTTATFAYEPAPKPTTNDADSPWPLSVSGAHKAKHLQFATLRNGLLFLILAYFLN